MEDHVNQVKELIGKVGLKRFAKIFVDAHQNEWKVLNINEFTYSEPKTIDEEQLLDDIADEYDQEKKQFDLDFYERHLPKMSAETVATVIGNSNDVSQVVFDEMQRLSAL